MVHTRMPESIEGPGCDHVTGPRVWRRERPDPKPLGVPLQDDRRREIGAVGWGLLWLLGIPIPILIVLFALRGCT